MLGTTRDGKMVPPQLVTGVGAELLQDGSIGSAMAADLKYSQLHGGGGNGQGDASEDEAVQESLKSASSLGAAVYCVQQSVEYANERAPFGTPLSHNQGIQFPLVELATQCEMLRQLIRKTALEMDSMPHNEIEKKIGSGRAG